MTNSMIPYSFIPGTKAKAGEVNANFVSLANVIEQNRQTAADDLQELTDIVDEKADKEELTRDFIVNTTNTDLDDYRTAGNYIFTSTYKPTNIPKGNSGVLSVLGKGTRVKQIWYTDGAIPEMYVRFYSGSGWGNWAASTTSKNASNLGYIKFSNGIIIQWGYTTFNSSSTTVTFPTAFTATPQVCFGGHASSNSIYAVGALHTSKSTTSFTAHGWRANSTTDCACSWIAIGY